MSEGIAETWRRLTKQKAELEKELEALVEQKGVPSVATSQRLSLLSSGFVRDVANFEADVAAMQAKEKRSWEKRAENLSEDAVQIEGSIGKQLGHFFKKQKEDSDRERLFGDKSKRGGDDGGLRSQLSERSALEKANQMMDDVLGQGGQVFSNLLQQNQTLKLARKKLLDAANVIGVSSSLVNVIDRRQTGDKWLVYGGMVLTLFVLFSLWYLLRW